jgi:hypothetical protein
MMPRTARQRSIKTEQTKSSGCRVATYYVVGDRVRLMSVGKRWNGKLGFITRIDGEYHYVRPRWYKHEIELYREEFELA